jgi:hypothetical protein
MIENLPVVAQRENLAAKADGMTTQELREWLVSCLEVSSRNLLELAVCVAKLEERGEDLSGIRGLGLVHHLRRIACGQLLPEVVAKFAGSPTLIARIGSLPIPDQERIIAGEFLLLAVYATDGSITNRSVDPLLMDAWEIRQVFARDHIRSQSEQALILERRRAETKGRRPKQIGVMHMDYERGGVTVGRKFIPQADLVSALQALKR